MSKPKHESLTDITASTETPSGEIPTSDDPRNFYPLAEVHRDDSELYKSMVRVNNLSRKLCFEAGCSSYQDLPKADKDKIIAFAQATVEKDIVEHHE